MRKGKKLNSFYKKEEYEKLGLKKVGENVLISRNASIYSPQNISIGNNVRIDDFALLSGKIHIKNFVHISAYTALFGGKKGIYIDDFVALSSRNSIYAVNDDYSGNFMSNPMVPIEYRNVTEGKVMIEKHVMIGSCSIVLPNIKLREGSVFGAMSYIIADSEEWSINVGIPAKKIKERRKNILQLEKEFLKTNL